MVAKTTTLIIVVNRLKPEKTSENNSSTQTHYTLNFTEHGEKIEGKIQTEILSRLRRELSSALDTTL